jgi:hypothetical protein
MKERERLNYHSVFDPGNAAIQFPLKDRTLAQELSHAFDVEMRKVLRFHLLWRPSLILRHIDRRTGRINRAEQASKALLFPRYGLDLEQSLNGYELRFKKLRERAAANFSFRGRPREPQHLALFYFLSDVAGELRNDETENLAASWFPLKQLPHIALVSHLQVASGLAKEQRPKQGQG